MTTDVVVIGAGITGSMAAQELTEAGYSVLILDRRKAPLLGATIATTALLQYEIDTPLTHLQKIMGVKDAIRAWRRSRLALDNLQAKITSLAIDCQLEEKQSLYLCGNLLDSKELKTEWQARNGAGLYCDYLTQGTLIDRFHIKRRAALHSFGNLSANPVDMAAGFLKRALQEGARVVAPVKVLGLKNQGQKVVVHCEGGLKIKANYVVSCTGYEIPDCLKSRRLKVNSTYAFATRKQKSRLWPEEPLIWEASDPYLYMRTTAEGRVICGGVDEEFENEEKRDKLLARKTKSLEQQLKKLFPDLDTTAEYAWCGSFGSANTGLPTIGPIPGLKNCFAVLAFGGNGITFSRMAAEMIRSVLQGHEDPDYRLFWVK